jgi:tRNA threonylcarbamoyladenosine modification (KEOPS) complex  Pcc1 subunit
MNAKQYWRIQLSLAIKARDTVAIKATMKQLRLVHWAMNV